MLFGGSYKNLLSQNLVASPPVLIVISLFTGVKKDAFRVLLVGVIGLEPMTLCL